MWRLFSKKSTKDTEGLEARLEKIEHDFRRLQEEWTDVYSKFRTLQMRVAKQAQRIEQAPEGEATGPAESESVTPQGTPLSARQTLIQRQILERRNRMTHLQSLARREE